MFHEIMLYRPLQKEVSFEDVEALFMEEYNGKRKIDIVKSQVLGGNVIMKFPFELIGICAINHT